MEQKCSPSREKESTRTNPLTAMLVEMTNLQLTEKNLLLMENLLMENLLMENLLMERINLQLTEKNLLLMEMENLLLMEMKNLLTEVKTKKEVMTQRRTIKRRTLEKEE